MREREIEEEIQSFSDNSIKRNNKKKQLKHITSSKTMRATSIFTNERIELNGDSLIEGTYIYIYRVSGN